MITLSIDPSTNDLFLEENGNLALAENSEAIAQHARQRLMTFEGEWDLDTEAGIPWLQQIFGMGYDPALAEALVKGEIFDTFGVTEITSFSVSFDRVTRGFGIKNVTVKTIFDDEVSV